MTLEHVHDVSDFLRRLRRTVGDRPETVVFFMIPEITRILNLRAFWDIYYEHCSYWSPGSLARAFRIAGFDPLQVWTDYDDQYVLIAARPGAGNGKILSNEEPPAALAAKVRGFTEAVAVDRARWRDWLERLRRAGQKTVLWGGGSKAVAFLTTLDVTEGPDYAVDINPRRNGTFIAGTGQQIVLPEFLAQHQPDVVIVMSPIYLPEITAQLEGLGVHPNCLAPSRRPPPRRLPGFGDGVQRSLTQGEPCGPRHSAPAPGGPILGPMSVQDGGGAGVSDLSNSHREACPGNCQTACNIDPRLECAPGAGQIALSELTGHAGLPEDGSHGTVPTASRSSARLRRNTSPAKACTDSGSGTTCRAT